MKAKKEIQSLDIALAMVLIMYCDIFHSRLLSSVLLYLQLQAEQKCLLEMQCSERGEQVDTGSQKPSS